eukprot:1159228-Pelagomonas_calceolata.AAC.5
MLLHPLVLPLNPGPLEVCAASLSVQVGIGNRPSAGGSTPRPVRQLVPLHDAPASMLKIYFSALACRAGAPAPRPVR